MQNLLQKAKILKPNPTPPRKRLGNQGELQAKKLLQSKGYKYLTSNFFSKYGEIDLIFRDGKTIVFVEVKTRTSASQTLPQHAVNQKKLQNITKTAQLFLQTNQITNSPCRIDVVAIIDSSPPQIKHLENVTGF